MTLKSSSHNSNDPTFTRIFLPTTLETTLHMQHAACSLQPACFLLGELLGVECGDYNNFTPSNNRTTRMSPSKQKTKLLAQNFSHWFLPSFPLIFSLPRFFPLFPLITLAVSLPSKKTQRLALFLMSFVHCFSIFSNHGR